MVIGVVDYEAGNLKSVENSLRFVAGRMDGGGSGGVSFTVSGDPETLLRSDKLIFPGVGEAGAAMKVLERRGLDAAIREFVSTGKPTLGICLGSQIILTSSEESSVSCLSLIPGTAKLFAPVPGLKVPHMGWNEVDHDGTDPLLEGVPEGGSFYFDHSYYTVPEDQADAIAWTEYGVRFASGLRRGNLAAFQFHPEKSGRNGLRLFENFIRKG